MKNKLLLIETVILTVILLSRFNKTPTEQTAKPYEPYPATSVTAIDAEDINDNSSDSSLETDTPSQDIIDGATDTIKQFVKGDISIDDVRTKLEDYIDKQLAE